MFEPDELLLALTRAQVEFVVIGGVAVAVHGFVRATQDLDIVPARDAENLQRLAQLLEEIDAQHVGIEGFERDEFPYDATDPAALLDGANLRLETRLGPIDIMQWVAGLDGESAYNELSTAIVSVAFRGAEIHVCSLKHLLAMKRAAARPQDLEDLGRLLDPHSGP
jgi:hypothetical protein